MTTEKGKMRLIIWDNRKLIFLQETHLKFEAGRFIRSGWGFDCFLSGVETNKNDVAVLFSDAFECNIFDTVRDPGSGELRMQKSVPSGENTELKRSPFKAWSRSVYSHTCYAYCQGFLPCLFLPFRSIHLHSPVLAVANTWFLCRPAE